MINTSHGKSVGKYHMVIRVNSITSWVVLAGSVGLNSMFILVSTRNSLKQEPLKDLYLCHGCRTESKFEKSWVHSRGHQH